MKEIKLIIPDDVGAVSITMLSKPNRNNMVLFKVYAVEVDGSDIEIKWDEQGGGAK